MALIVAVQPLASVTTTVYVPDIKLSGSWIVALFDHTYVYGAVPPDGLRSIDPVLFPKHNTLTCVVAKLRGA